MFSSMAIFLYFLRQTELILNMAGIKNADNKETVMLSFFFLNCAAFLSFFVIEQVLSYKLSGVFWTE